MGLDFLTTTDGADGQRAGDGNRAMPPACSDGAR